MATVLIVVYLLIVLALIVVILLQRSEGGGLGMSSGGGGGGGMISARGSANLLTRTTAILGTLFMVTAIGLTIVGQLDDSSSAILDQAVDGDGAPVTVLDALDSLSGDSDADLALPEAETPAPVTEDGADLALPAADEGDLAVQDAPAADAVDPVTPLDEAPVDQTPVEENSIEQPDVEGSPAAEGGADLAQPESGEEAPPASPN